MSHLRDGRRQTRVVLTAAIIALAMVAPTPALAQEGEASPLQGSIEMAYRDVSIDGNEDKYKEDVNLDDGNFYLSDLALEYQPQEPGWFDFLRLDASSIGGEPYSSARFSLRKVGSYDLDLRYRSTDYFYRDAGYFFRDGGDLHTWDATRDFLVFGLTVQATERLTLRFGADHNERDGGSTTSRDIQRDVFQLMQPLDQEASSYWAGADIRIGWANVNVEQRFSTYENRWQETATATDGEEVGAAFLDDYSQLSVDDNDTTTSRILISGNPLERLEFNLGYAHMNADVDFSADGAWSGTDFDGFAFDTTLTNTGNNERDTDLLDLDVTVTLRDDLDLTLDAAHHTWDQDGTIDSIEEQIGGTEAGQFIVQGNLTNELTTDTYGATLDWQATPTLGFAIGAGMQERTASFDLSGPDVDTERTIYRGRARWRPNRIWSFLVDYEQGDDDEPLAPVSVTSRDRITARADVRPVQRLSLSLEYKDETKENEDSYSLGVPTDDVPPADEIVLAEFDVTTYSVLLTWAGQSLNLLGGYTNTDIDSDAHIVYVTGATFVPVLDILTTRDRTSYMADQDVYHANVRYQFTQRWSAGAEAVTVDNTGTFPVDSKRYGAHVRYEMDSGLWFRTAFDRYDYDEDNPFAGDPASPTPDVNDYDADLFTVAVGYRF